MRWKLFASLFVLAFTVMAQAESAKIIKVLPHLLDQNGRHATHPSLLDRDAYQQELRSDPSKRAGLRFDVQWKATGYSSLVLRIEAKGGKTNDFKMVTLEKPVKGGLLSKWTAVPLSAAEYEEFGNLVSWRATLLSGTNVVAQQVSFLW